MNILGQADCCGALQGAAEYRLVSFHLNVSPLESNLCSILADWVFGGHSEPHKCLCGSVTVTIHITFYYFLPLIRKQSLCIWGIVFENISSYNFIYRFSFLGNNKTRPTNMLNKVTFLSLTQNKSRSTLLTYICKQVHTRIVLVAISKL